MNILIVMDNVFPPIIRVEKESRMQLKAGHRLYLLSEGENGRPDEEDLLGIHVFRRRPRKNLASRAFNYFCFPMVFRNPYWEREIIRVLENEDIDAIEAHNLPMVKIALPIARKYNIPIIADMHENYPEAIKFWRTGIIDKTLGIVSPIWRWKHMEKCCLRQVDKVLTVVDEAGEHYVAECGVSPEKVVVVMNVEDLDYFCSLPVEEMKEYSPYYNILYCGGFGVHRGIQTAIQAMPRILSEIKNARLILVGSGSNEDDLFKLANELDVAGKVEFCGQQPFSQVPSFVAASQVCLVPHISSGHTDSTIPHKLFQYMAMSKPVVVSTAKPLARIVHETGAGLVYPSGDAEGLAEAILSIHKDKEFAARLGEAGRKAVEEKYNWKKESKKLTRMYQELGGIG